MKYNMSATTRADCAILARPPRHAIQFVAPIL